MRRLLVLALAGAILLPATAHASTALRGRSVATQVRMDAALLMDHGPIQVLTSLCERPSHLRRCTPMSGRMQQALQDAIANTITWVDARRRGGPTFVVFAPVAFDGADARAEMAFWETGRHACRGGAVTSYTRVRGAWAWTSQLAWFGCQATPV